MSGVGKSTIGRQLSNKVGCLFIDLDSMIEENYGMSIKSIFEEEGFREKEIDTVKKITLTTFKENVILSTGGVQY